MIGPHREGGLLVFRERNFFFFFPPDFSGAKASKNIHMIWPPTREINHQEELNKQKGFKKKSCVKLLLAKWYCFSLFLKWKPSGMFFRAEICFEGPEPSTLIMLLFVGEDACTCRLVAASKVQLWKFLAAVIRPSGQCFVWPLVKCHQMAFKWPGGWEKYCPYPYSGSILILSPLFPSCYDPEYSIFAFTFTY